MLQNWWTVSLWVSQITCLFFYFFLCSFFLPQTFVCPPPCPFCGKSVFFFLFFFFPLRYSVCSMKMEKDENQTSFLEKAEESKYVMELYYLRSVFWVLFLGILRKYSIYQHKDMIGNLVYQTRYTGRNLPGMWLCCFWKFVRKRYRHLSIIY